MNGSRVLIDTGPLVGLYDRNDEHHYASPQTMRQVVVPAFTCWPVITEAVYLLRESEEAVGKLLGKIESGDLRILPLTQDDVPLVAQFLRKYHDQGTSLADACLMHLAEREGIDNIFTIDSDFRIYRTASGKSLTLMPILGDQSS